MSHFIFKSTLYFLLGILAFMSSGFCIGSRGYDVDSLKNLIKTHENNTGRINNLILIAREYKNSDLSAANAWLDTVLSLSGQLGFKEGTADALIEKSNIYRMKGNIDSSAFFGEKAIQFCDSVNDPKRLADSYLCYGSSLRLKGENEKAFQYYKKGLNIYMGNGDSSGIVQAYNRMGIIYEKRSLYDSAIYYYHHSIRICKNSGDQKGMSAALINLGKVYHITGDLGNSKKYFLESIDYSKRYGNLQHYALALVNLGMVAFDEMDFNRALEYYNQSLEISEQLRDLPGVANLYNNIGNIYFEQKKDYNKALEYYQKALSLFREIGHKDGMLINLMNIAVIYEKRGNYTAALSMNDTCLLLAKEREDLKSQKTIYKNILAIYRQTGDHKMALDYQDKYYEIKDSIFNIDKAKAIADLTLKYEKEKDQALILTLENENLAKDLDLKRRTNEKNIFLFAALGVICIVLFLFIFYRFKAKKDKIIAQQKIKQLEEEKKLLAARAIVEGQEEERKRLAKELHDGLGVLLATAKMQFSAIKDKSPENKPLIEKAHKLLEQASGDVRKISHNMMPGLLTKFGFFEATEDLFDQINDAKGPRAVIKIEGELARLTENLEIMLYRVVQEMVNNTLKHANAQNISLILTHTGHHLHLQYADDGKGFNVQEIMEAKTIGLNSIVSRVKFINGTISIESEPGKGSKYIIQIPVSYRPQ